jgi:hypothetical protein
MSLGRNGEHGRLDRVGSDFRIKEGFLPMHAKAIARDQ